MPGGMQIDLVVLVPDKQMEAALKALLQRPEALKIRGIDFEIVVHPRRDPGCRGESSGLLSVFASRASFCLVVFDHEGCGEHQSTREELEDKVESSLAANGWDGRCAVVVISPELEAWVWSDSPVVDQALGWSGVTPSLRDWLRAKGYLQPDESKPVDPKRTLEAALRQVRKRRSSSIYGELATRVSVSRCADPSFEKLKAILVQWFPK